MGGNVLPSSDYLNILNPIQAMELLSLLSNHARHFLLEEIYLADVRAAVK